MNNISENYNKNTTDFFLKNQPSISITVDKIIQKTSKHLFQNYSIPINPEFSNSNPMEKMNTLKNHCFSIFALKNMYGLQLELYTLLLMKEKEHLSLKIEEPIKENNSQFIIEIENCKLMIKNQNQTLNEKIRSITQEMLNIVKNPQKNEIHSQNQEKNIDPELIFFESSENTILKEVFERTIEYSKNFTLDETGSLNKNQQNSTVLNSKKLFKSQRVLNNVVELQNHMLNTLAFREKKLSSNHPLMIPLSNLTMSFKKEEEIQRAYRMLVQEIKILQILIKKEAELINKELWRISEIIKSRSN